MKSHSFLYLFIILILQLGCIKKEEKTMSIIDNLSSLYLLDDKFKTQIHEWKNLEPSGSRL